MLTIQSFSGWYILRNLYEILPWNFPFQNGLDVLDSTIHSFKTSNHLERERERERKREFTKTTLNDAVPYKVLKI